MAFNDSDMHPAFKKFPGANRAISSFSKEILPSELVYLRAERSLGNFIGRFDANCKMSLKSSLADRSRFKMKLDDVMFRHCFAAHMYFPNRNDRRNLLIFLCVF